MSTAIQIALLTGLIYGFVTVGMGIAFRVLDYPDLTLEGGGVFSAVCAFLVFQWGGGWVMSLLGATVAGGLAGFLTSLWHTRLKVGRLFSGIITAAVLYSLNLRLLGGLANARLSNEAHTLYDLWGRGLSTSLLLLLMPTIVIGIILFMLFNTRVGFLWKALGDRSRSVTSLGYNPAHLITLGLVVANAIIGCGMGLLFQYRRVVDLNMVGGLLVASLASMLLGEVLFRPKRIESFLAAMFGGTIAYSLAVGVALFSWFDGWERLIQPGDIRLITGLVLLLAASLARRFSAYRLFASSW